MNAVLLVESTYNYIEVYKFTGNAYNFFSDVKRIIDSKIENSLSTRIVAIFDKYTWNEYFLPIFIRCNRSTEAISLILEKARELNTEAIDLRSNIVNPYILPFFPDQKTSSGIVTIHGSIIGKLSDIMYEEAKTVTGLKVAEEKVQWYLTHPKSYLETTWEEVSIERKKAKEKYETLMRILCNMYLDLRSIHDKITLLEEEYSVVSEEEYRPIEVILRDELEKFYNIEDFLRFLVRKIYYSIVRR